ncbi:MAG: peptidoglycan DD-metalloendopeptidase family protein [Armatimonadetes bacterium]|nr:peptidoglycan DD-metalloendopeptidase family protein [Armatimonadota bacterium]
MQKPGRHISAFVFVVLIAAVFAEPHAEAISLSKLRQQWQNAARSINYLQQKLRPIKKKQRVATEKLVQAKHKLVVTERNLRDVQGQLLDTKNRLVVTMSMLDMLQQRLKARNDLLAGRLVDSYKYGNVNYMSVFLGASDFWDLLNGGYIVRKILQKDVELLESIRSDKQAVEEKKVILQEQKRQRAELELKHRHLTYAAREQTAECRQLLGDIQRQRAELERQLAGELASSARLGAMIRRMQSTPEGRRRLATPWHGSFSMPVNGRISSSFGMRYHPILHSYRPHTGTDIAAPSGTSIHAAASGVVVFAGRLDRWYGNTVMIDHGGGMSTFYGHCSSVSVGNGASVRRGQTIARVGSTGRSTGPHVHFEVQKNGRPVSPFGGY